MPESTPAEYPNQYLDIDFVTNANAGTVNQLTAPLQLGNQNNGNGSIISSGSGTPTSNNLGGNVGDLYIRTDGVDATFFYRCSVAGTAGNATWVAITGA